MKQSTNWAIFGGILAGSAGNWLITPMRHPDASPLLYAWVWIQFIGGIALIVYAFRVRRRERIAEAEDVRDQEPVA